MKDSGRRLPGGTAVRSVLTGLRVEHQNVRDADECGISVIYQEFNLVP